jgi:hypothetical protein
LRPASPGTAGAPPALPNEPARTPTLAGGPAAAAITFDGAHLFVVEHASGKVVTYDVPARRLLATIDTGGEPRAILTEPYPPVPAEQSGESQPARQSSSAGQLTDAGRLPRAGLVVALALALLAMCIYSYEVRPSRVRHSRSTSRRRRR